MNRSVATLAASDAVEFLWFELSGVAPNTCPDAALVSGEWVAHWEAQSLLQGFSSSSIVDVTSYDASGNPDGECSYEINVSWKDERFESEDVASLTYLASLPVKPEDF